MILVFNIKNSDVGAWQIYQDSQILFSHEFGIIRGEDQSLAHLQELLQTNNIEFKNIKGFILLVKDASLTQVKVFTTTANVLAWQLGIPILGEYYFSARGGSASGGKGKEETTLKGLLSKIAKEKKFKALSPKYSNKKVITISKKQPKYKISK